MFRKTAAALLLLSLSAAPVGGQTAAQPAVATEFIHAQVPEYLAFQELKALAVHPYPTSELRQRYERLWTTPTISNEAYYEDVAPHAPSDPRLGRLLRVVTWNIEQSLHLDEAIEAFTDEQTYRRQLHPRKAKPGSRRERKALRDRALLEQADVILLQEMEVGVKRSGYRDAPAELAQELRMNYAFLPEYLEIDPVLLGEESIYFREGQLDKEAMAYFAVDPARYQGLFGCAVLSRYPIVHAEGFRLFNQGYDWYWQEQQKTPFLEKLRRFGARAVFREDPHREMKLGGRTYFRVDLYVPELPEQRLTVINVHLEIKCQPEARAAQLLEILNYIKHIHHPVILAGDFNSAPHDLSPTSTPRAIARGVSSPEFWLGRVMELFLPQALVINVTRYVSNITKNYQNPTAVHIPVVAPNPTGELFSIIERFRFNDGGAFDFRGTRRASAGDTGTLSNANERDLWAYKTTFRTDRTLAKLAGKYRLDWIFVKSYLKHPKDNKGPYRFAPHFGRTLNALNKYLKVRISDHDPSLVDLPFNEPPTER